MAISSMISSGEKTADGAIYNGRARVSAVQIITDGTNPADVILYDNGSAASGTKLFEGGCAGSTRSALYDFTQPIRAENGVYLDITGTGASCIIYLG